MPTLDQHSAYTNPPAHLNAAHAFVLLDALSAFRMAIREHGVTPWHGWQQATRPGDAPTEQEYLAWLREAGDLLATMLDGELPAILVPYTGGDADAAAALNLRTYEAEDGERSGRIVADLHGVTVDVARRADHTAVDLNVEDVPEEFAPVRVCLGDQELTDPYPTRVTAASEDGGE